MKDAPLPDGKCVLYYEVDHGTVRVCIRFSDGTDNSGVFCPRTIREAAQDLLVYADEAEAQMPRG